METFALAATSRHVKIQIATERRFEFIDVTPDVEALVAQTGIDVGFVNVQSLHTTTSIVVNEREPQLLTDFADLLERVAPPGAWYRHDDVTLRTVNVIPANASTGIRTVKRCCWPRRSVSTSPTAVCSLGAGSACFSRNWTGRRPVTFQS